VSCSWLITHLYVLFVVDTTRTIPALSSPVLLHFKAIKHLFTVTRVLLRKLLSEGRCSYRQRMATAQARPDVKRISGRLSSSLPQRTFINITLEEERSAAGDSSYHTPDGGSYMVLSVVYLAFLHKPALLRSLNNQLVTPFPSPFNTPSLSMLHSTHHPLKTTLTCRHLIATLFSSPVQGVAR
jgi:hypothetical protein